MPSVLLRKSKRSLLALSAEATDDVDEQKPAVAPKPKRTLANTQPSAEERALEDALFGKSSRFLSAAPAEADGEDAAHAANQIKDEDGAASASKRPAWVDDDDSHVSVSLVSETRTRKLRKTEEEDVVTGAEYTEKLRERFTTTYSAHQAWAEAREADDEDGIQQWAGALTKGAKSRLPQSLLEVSRMTDVNHQEYSKAAIQCTRFHSNAAVVLTAGLDKSLRLFQVDGKENTKIQSVFFKDMPIMSADFSTDGSHIFLSGRRPFFYAYDMQKGVVDKIHRLQGREEKSLESMHVSPNGKHIAFLGDHGTLLLVDCHTRRLVDTMKMNGSSRAVAFNADGTRMYSHGTDGQVYVWDMNARACIHTFVDEGCFHGTKLTVSSDSSLLATGSDSGVVNIYDVKTCMKSETPSPLKAVLNLTTRIDMLEFNHDTQMLAMGSRMKKDALKMLHVPSLTVFNNWPTGKTPVRFAHSVAFSPHSGYCAFGNDRGRTLLYRLNHYTQS